MSYDYPDFGFSRLNWYDRSPIARAAYYVGVNVAPHVPLVVFTYTVPAGKKAMLELSQAYVMRTAAAIAAGRVYSFFRYTPFGGAFINMLTSGILTNGVGDRDTVFLSQTILMFAGDRLEGLTSDGSNGGTIDYILSYKVTEFDE